MSLPPSLVSPCQLSEPGHSLLGNRRPLCHGNFQYCRALHDGFNHGYISEDELMALSRRIVEINEELKAPARAFSEVLGRARVLPPPCCGG
jgi:hypothetical protein